MSNRKPATAPFNFVPLNKAPHCLESERKDFHQGNDFSGEIQLNFKAISPFFTRGEKSENFKINGEYAIPGSSIRGMVRNLIDIVSYGSFLPGQDFEDKRLFYRNFGDRYFRDQILKRERLGGGQFNVKLKAKAGWLSKNGKDYFIQPAQSIDGVQIFRIEGEFTNDEGNLFKPNHKEEEEMAVPGQKIIYFNPQNIKRIYKTQKKKLTFKLAYNILNTYGFQEQAGFQKGHLLLTGALRKKKHFQPVILDPEESASLINVTQVVEVYESDSTKSPDFDLLKKLEETNEAVPCFYLEKRNGIWAMGHTPVFRLPYDFLIGKRVPVAMKSQNGKATLSDKIFGRPNSEDEQKLIAGKTYFQDAKITHFEGTELGIPKTLSSPKPTAFQNYLTQPKGIDTPKDQLHHWDKRSAEIRGYKLYWHRLGANWKQDQAEMSGNVIRDYFDVKEGHLSAEAFLEKYGDNFDRVFRPKKTSENKKKSENENKPQLLKLSFKKEKPYESLPDDLREVLDGLFFQPENNKTQPQFAPIKVLKAGTEFSGSIRFSNLSKEELGAILFVLDLDETKAHKIGMGKPLGLGSMRVTPELVLSPKAARYSRFFADNGWHTPPAYDQGSTFLCLNSSNSW